jgi:hypothetical protein
MPARHPHVPLLLWQSTVSFSSGETKTSWPIAVAKLDARASRRGRARENGIRRLGPIGENRWAAEQYAVDRLTYDILPDINYRRTMLCHNGSWQFLLIGMRISCRFEHVHRQHRMETSVRELFLVLPADTGLVPFGSPTGPPVNWSTRNKRRSLVVTGGNLAAGRLVAEGEVPTGVVVVGVRSR